MLSWDFLSGEFSSKILFNLKFEENEFYYTDLVKILLSYCLVIDLVICSDIWDWVGFMFLDFS